MQKRVIEDFFDHILQRQMAQGPKRAFRFKRIKLHDGSVSPAQYPNDLNSPKPSRRMHKCTGRQNAAVPNVDSPAPAPNAAPIPTPTPDPMPAPTPDRTPAPDGAPAPAPNPNPEGQSHALAASHNPHSQPRARKAAKGKSKTTIPVQRSMAEQAHNLNTSATLSNKVQVN